MAPVSNQEFNGPFPDWWNVVDDFGADPTGMTDSSGAFQSMFDAMGVGAIKDGRYIGVTGYVPTGTYSLGIQLTLPRSATSPSAQGVNLWGQDPATTILKWTGGPASQILWSDGCNSSIIGRLTFDGQGMAAIGVRQERDPDISLENTYSRLQDCIIKNVQYGFYETSGLSPEGLDSEFSILRCEFYNCSQAAVLITKPEAYNYWVRQCYFEDCNYGIQNGPSGAFSAYDNVFVRSVVSDIYAETGMRICGIRRNASFNSNRFAYINNCVTVMVGNSVYHPTQTDAIQLANRYKVTIANNKIQSLPGVTTGPVIKELTNQYYFETLSPFSTLFVLFNQFTVSDPILITPNTPTGTDIQSNLLSPSMALTQPALPPHPPQVVRQTFIIDTSVEDAQVTVDAAAAYAIANPGSDPVVYLPLSGSETRSLVRTLVFPANIRMSLQGGGAQTYFYWGGPSLTTVDPYVLFRGPSKVSVMNMAIAQGYYGGGKSGLIAVFDNCNQSGSRIYADNCKGAFSYSSLSNTRVDVCDHVTDPTNPENGIITLNNLDEAAGDGRVLHEGGAGSSGDGSPQFDIRGGGRYYLRDFWYETPGTDAGWASLGGMGGRDGKFTVESSFLQQSSGDWTTPMVQCTDWRGDFLYLAAQFSGGTSLSGLASRVNFLSFGGSAAILSGSSAPASMYRQDGPAADGESWTSNAGWGVFGAKPANWQERLWDTFTRAPVIWLDPLGQDVTDVRLYRTLADVAFMADTYVLPSPVKVTDFMSGVLPADALFSRASEASMYNASTLQLFAPDNLFPASEDLSDPSWTPSSGGTGSNPIVTPNDAIAPDGTMTACKLVFDTGSSSTAGDISLITTNVNSLTVGDPFFGRILGGDILSGNQWINGTSGTQILAYSWTMSTYSVITCTGAWQRLTFSNGTYTAAGALQAFGLQQDLPDVGSINSSATVWLWGLQLNRRMSQWPYYVTSGEAYFGLRFDHDPLTGALLGALVEPASANNITGSDVRGLWDVENASLSQYDIIGPNGLPALTITASAGPGDHFSGKQGIGVGVGAIVGHSAFVKQGTTRYAVVFDDSDSLWHGATFDFTVEAWVGTGTNVTLLLPQKLANGWWRLGWIAAMVDDVCSMRVAPAPMGTGTATDINYDAAGTENVYAIGLQCDNPDVGVTSYIPTINAPVARDIDLLKILRDNGTYDIEIIRRDGVLLLADQVITDGTFTIAPNLSPLMKVVTTRK